jgi:hypothetical protein
MEVREFVAGTGADIATIGDLNVTNAGERARVRATPKRYTCFCWDGVRNAQSTCKAPLANMNQTAGVPDDSMTEDPRSHG